jgi:phage shock protein C
MRKLYRSRRDSKLFGLCGGLAEMLNIDATLLRLVVVVTAFFSGGTVIPLYIVACLVIPKEPVFDSTFMHPGMQPPTPPYVNRSVPPTRPQEPSADRIDEMMKDIEKKAMQKEMEELKAKLAKYEKGDV